MMISPQGRLWAGQAERHCRRSREIFVASARLDCLIAVACAHSDTHATRVSSVRRRRVHRRRRADKGKRAWRRHHKPNRPWLDKLLQTYISRCNRPSFAASVAHRHQSASFVNDPASMRLAIASSPPCRTKTPSSRMSSAQSEPFSGPSRSFLRFGRATGQRIPRD